MYYIVHENAPQSELNRIPVPNQDNLRFALISYINDLGTLEAGDTFKIIETED